MSSESAGCVAYVLDAAALFASYQLMLPPNVKVVTTPEVMEEVKDEVSRESLELSLSAGKLDVVEVGEALIDEALKVAVDLGELSRLSKADLSLVALMIKYMREGCSVVVVSDDYSIQNVAAYLNLYLLGVKRKVIERVVKYIWVCEGCGFRGGSSGLCPVCGTRMVRKPLKVRGFEGFTTKL
ncbi:MAG: hypothetical protein RMH77_00150 [Sulfolobales archaeon]|nr:hypothetical protein [Sulfolobales archaeon]MCX8186933.1 hypothetical protein [Sulfolobales archaeon]MDW7968810.1 hypothetical protein [Sulfolobales archaeon]